MKSKPEALTEILRGLDGLVMLCQWQKTLADDLRSKVAALLEDDNDNPPRGDSAKPPGR